MKVTKNRKVAEPKARRRIKFRGIGADAIALGVHRIHLYAVLDGRRESRSLTARYAALKASQIGGEA